MDAKWIDENWRSGASSLAWAFEWVQNNYATPATLANEGILVSVGAAHFFYQKKMSARQANFEAVLRRWYYTRQLQSGGRQAVNYKIGVDFTELHSYFASDANLNFPEVRLNVESILSLGQTNDNRYRCIQNIVAMISHVDLLTGSKLDFDQAEDHHVFPFSLAKSMLLDKKLINSLANKILVTKESNRQLSNKQPDEYIRHLAREASKHGTLPDLEKRFQQCMMPYDRTDQGMAKWYKIENFENVLRFRAKEILKAVRSVIGESLSESADRIETEEDE